MCAMGGAQGRRIETSRRCATLQQAAAAHDSSTQHSPPLSPPPYLPLPPSPFHTHAKVLREEAHTLRVLRHAHAEAAIRTLDAERALVMKEQAVARIALKKWERTHMAISEPGRRAMSRRAPTRRSTAYSSKRSSSHAGGYGYVAAAARTPLTTHQLPPLHSLRPTLQRLTKRRKRAYAKLNAAGVALQQAAEEVDADEAMVQAAEDARRGKEDLHGGGGGGGGGGMHAAARTPCTNTPLPCLSLILCVRTLSCGQERTLHQAQKESTRAAARRQQRGGTKVVRRWTQGMKGDVAAREQAYELVLERSTSRQLLDGCVI